jgi:hypothetical protein
MKQHELPNNSKVKLPDGTWALFLKMDGMYAHWKVNGELKIGSFEEFKKVDDYYEVVN